MQWFANLQKIPRIWTNLFAHGTRQKKSVVDARDLQDLGWNYIKTLSEIAVCEHSSEKSQLFFLGKYWYCVLKTKEKKDHPAFISIRYITVYIGLEQHMLPSWWCLFLPFHTSGWQCYTAYFSTRVQVLNCCFLKLSHFKHFMFSIKYEFIKFINHCSVFIYILQYFLEFGLFFTLRYPQ